MGQSDDIRSGYEKAKADAVAAIPTTWLDDLLTGPKAVLNGNAGKWGCPDIEKLLRAIRDRILALNPEL